MGEGPRVRALLPFPPKTSRVRRLRHFAEEARAVRGRNAPPPSEISKLEAGIRPPLSTRTFPRSTTCRARLSRLKGVEMGAWTGGTRHPGACRSRINALSVNLSALGASPLFTPQTPDSMPRAISQTPRDVDCAFQKPTHQRLDSSESGHKDKFIGAVRLTHDCQKLRTLLTGHEKKDMSLVAV